MWGARHVANMDVIDVGVAGVVCCFVAIAGDVQFR